MWRFQFYLLNIWVICFPHTHILKKCPPPQASAMSALEKSRPISMQMETCFWALYSAGLVHLYLFIPILCNLTCFSLRIILISGSQVLPCGSSFWVSCLFSVLCSFIHIFESACQVSPKAQGNFDWNYTEFRKSCIFQVYVHIYLTMFCRQIDYLYSVILH